MEDGSSPTPLAKLTLDIFAEIKARQQQNGLTHDDYLRYRQYCTRKLHRLRNNKSVKFTHHGAKGKFEAKEITADICVTSRHLELPLMKAERAWSYAMQLKQELESDISPEKNTNNKKARHMIQRMKKAQLWAEKLHALCEQVGDERTNIESAAYYLFMKGNCDLEKDDLKNALVNFSSLKVFLERLVSASTGKEVLALKEKMENVEFVILYCTRYLSQEGINTDQLQKLMTSTSQQSTASSQVDSRVRKLAEDGLKLKAQEGFKVNVEGAQAIELVVSDSELAVHLLDLDNQEKMIMDLLSEATKDEQQINGESSKLDSSFLKYFSTIDDANILLRNSKSKMSIKADEKDILLKHLKRKKLTMMKKKNIILTTKLIEQFFDNSESTKMDNIVRMCDKIGQQLTELLEIGLPKDICLKIDTERAEVTIYKCFFVGLSQLAVVKEFEKDEAKNRNELKVSLAKAYRLFEHNTQTNIDQPSNRIILQKVIDHSRKFMLLALAKFNLLNSLDPGSTSRQSSFKIEKCDFDVNDYLNLKYTALPAKPFFFDLAFEKIRPENMNLEGLLKNAKKTQPNAETTSTTSKPNTGGQQGKGGGWLSSATGWFNRS